MKEAKLNNTTELLGKMKQIDNSIFTSYIVIVINKGVVTFDYNSYYILNDDTSGIYQLKK